MAKSEPDMEREQKSIVEIGQSQARVNEIFIGNFSIEAMHGIRKRGERYVNEEVERMESSGLWENVRTDVALDENEEIIIGKRAIYATSKEKLY